MTYRNGRLESLSSRPKNVTYSISLLISELVKCRYDDIWNWCLGITFDGLNSCEKAVAPCRILCHLLKRGILGATTSITWCKLCLLLTTCLLSSLYMQICAIKMIIFWSHGAAWIKTVVRFAPRFLKIQNFQIFQFIANAVKSCPQETLKLKWTFFRR